jgi:citrate synthase
LNVLINVRTKKMLIGAREAVRRLGVKPATLYAYVSRGLVRSMASPGSKEHRYYAADIEQLKRSKRKGRRTGTPPLAFDLFAPVLDSSLCLLDEGRHYYRGQDTTHLAQHATLEQVAELLWGVDPTTALASASELPRDFGVWLKHLSVESTAIERAKTILVQLARDDTAGIDTALPVVVRVSRLLVRALAAAITGKMPSKLPIHEQLAKAWRLDPIGADLVRRCLVLVADHELTASTYVARCVAATRASPMTSCWQRCVLSQGPYMAGKHTGRR